MDFYLNNNNNTLVNNNTKLLRWSIFLNIHYNHVIHRYMFPIQFGTFIGLGCLLRVSSSVSLLLKHHWSL